MEPDSIRVEAGEQIALSADVSQGAAGWVDSGPYFAYLSGETFGLTQTTSGGGIATDVELGELVTEIIGAGAGVTLTATIPLRTPPGEYQIVVCNQPCTSGLGDLLGGTVFVGVDPEPQQSKDSEPVPIAAEEAVGVIATLAPPESTATTYLALSPYPSRPTGLAAGWVAISAGLGAAVLLAAMISRRRSDS